MALDAFVDAIGQAQVIDRPSVRAIAAEQFSINATVTVGGAFLCTNSTKGGTAGTLYLVGAFSGGDKSLGSGDSLSLQGTFTQADDGVYPILQYARTICQRMRRR